MRTICWFYSYLYIDLKILTCKLKDILPNLNGRGGEHFRNLKYTCSKKLGSILYTRSTKVGPIYIYVFKEIRSYLNTRVERN